MHLSFVHVQFGGSGRQENPKTHNLKWAGPSAEARTRLEGDRINLFVSYVREILRIRKKLRQSPDIGI